MCLHIKSRFNRNICVADWLRNSMFGLRLVCMYVCVYSTGSGLWSVISTLSVMSWCHLSVCIYSNRIQVNIILDIKTIDFICADIFSYARVLLHNGLQQSWQACPLVVAQLKKTRDKHAQGALLLSLLPLWHATRGCIRSFLKKKFPGIKSRGLHRGNLAPH